MRIDYNPQTELYEASFRGEIFYGKTRLILITNVLKTLTWA